MMLRNDNIDLMREKNDLDAFLSACMEKADLTLGDEAQKPEEGDTLAGTAQVFSEPAAAAQSAAVGMEEIPETEDSPRPYYAPPGRELQEAVPEGQPEPQPFDAAPSEPDAPLKIEAAEIKTDTQENSIYETFSQREQDNATVSSPEGFSPSELPVELPKSHFSPNEDLSVTPVPLSALEREFVLENQELEKDRAAQSAEIADRSSLRKPSKNLAAREFARKQAEQKKRMRVMCVVLAIAVLIAGIFWLVPFQKITLPGSGTKQAVQADSSKATDANNAVAKKISRD